ncbi:MAG: hypothetical protein K2Q26_09160, partial [Bdellovibrionales bacterium]|nr:hypothetical protein [Bdellovibrionales bacterium]
MNLGSNPWELLPTQYFPYGSVLFAIMMVPKAVFYFIFGDAALGTNALSLIAFRAPLLIADICFLRVLLKFPLVQPRWIFIFYWLNPVLIFISYLHGQLDLFAVLFVFLALESCRRNRELASAVMLAFAILCKFHVVILIPVFMVYFWNTKFRSEAYSFLAKWLSIVLGLVAVGFLPHFLSSHFGYVSVQSPEAMKIFSLTLPLGADHKLYIGFGLVVAVLARLVLSSRVTKQGLIYASALLLGALLITTDSMPGWYYWLYPFLALFLAQYPLRLYSVLACSILLYLFCFLPAHFGLDISVVASQISFTLLQMSLLGLLISIWLFIIRIEMPWFRRHRPLLIGLAGNSGAGK